MNLQPTDQSTTPQLLDAWTQFLGQWDWDWFCTLTFGKPVHPESADKRFRSWVGAINRECAEHGAESVRWVRGLELQRRQVIHYHALLGGGGVDKLRRLTWMDAWSDLAGWARIERPRNATAVRRYAAKRYTAKGGDLDVGGPGMHELPASWWPREWQTWPTIRKLDRVRQVVTDDEWQQLQRWSRAPRRPIPDTGWCEPGFSAEPAFLAEIPARLARRRGSSAPAAGVGSGRRSERGAQGELGVGGGRRSRSQPSTPLRTAQGPGGPPRRGEQAQRA